MVARKFSEQLYYNISQHYKIFMTRIATNIPEEYIAFIFRINLTFSFEPTSPHGVIIRKMEVRVLTTVKTFDFPLKLNSVINRSILLTASCSGNTQQLPIEVSAQVCTCTPSNK
jgi:hypothetical protein